MAEEVKIVCISNWKHIDQGPVVLKVNKAIGFPNTYPLDSDLTGG